MMSEQMLQAGKKVFIRYPALADEQEFLQAVKQSRALHQSWTHTPRFPSEFHAWLLRMQQPANTALLVCRHDSRAIVGVITLTSIILGVLQSAYLGYYVFAGHERQGLMREGVQLAVRHAFKTLKLHRLEANIQPDNVASLALAKACGFSKEGFSPRYLKVRGRWKDHERWALLAG
jgi:ribosomal-protein-alanine N-acetyltransferase